MDPAKSTNCLDWFWPGGTVQVVFAHQMWPWKFYKFTKISDFRFHGFYACSHFSTFNDWIIYLIVYNTTSLFGLSSTQEWRLEISKMMPYFICFSSSAIYHLSRIKYADLSFMSRSIDMNESKFQCGIQTIMYSQDVQVIFIWKRVIGFN